MVINGRRRKRRKRRRRKRRRKKKKKKKKKKKEGEEQRTNEHYVEYVINTITQTPTALVAAYLAVRQHVGWVGRTLPSGGPGSALGVLVLAA